jgi:hypothetical protein
VHDLDPEPEVKGVLLLSRLAFLREYGSTPLDRVLARLAPEDSAVLRSPVLPAAWYPAGLRSRIDQAIIELISAEARLDVLVHMGRVSAEAMLSSAELSHLAAAAPHAFLGAVPGLYVTHHTAAGHREYERVDANVGVIRTSGAPQLVTGDDCWTVVGWLQRALELCGAEGVLVNETACRAAGAPCCEYRCEWHW